MKPLWKLATGLAASGLLANLAYGYERQEILTKLGRRSANTMLAAGITDGTARFQSAGGWTWRIARLSATATPAQRDRVTVRLARTAGIAGVEWEPARR